MPEVTKPLSKLRVQIDLSSREVERMNWMMDVCDIETRKDLFNNALTLMEWAIWEAGSGNKVASYNDEKKERNTLSMPILRTAVQNRLRFPKGGRDE